MKTNIFLVMTLSLLLLSVRETEATPDNSTEAAHNVTTKTPSSDAPPKGSGPLYFYFSLLKTFLGSRAGGACVMLVSTLAYTLMKN